MKTSRTPHANLPKATYIALGITTALYILISIGVFGTLTVDQVIGYGETALAEAARPVLGDAGFVMMAIAALLATFTSVNANVYGVVGLTSALARNGQFPPKFGEPGATREHRWEWVSRRLLVLLLALLVDLTAIASLGSVVALVIFLMVAFAGLRLRAETGSSIAIIILAIASTAIVLVVFGIQTWRGRARDFRRNGCRPRPRRGTRAHLERGAHAVARPRRRAKEAKCADDPRSAIPGKGPDASSSSKTWPGLVSHASCSFPGYPEEPVHEMRRASMELLERHGADVRELDLGEGKPAIYGDMPGPEGSPTVLLYAHYDVQPAPVEAGWDTDPWQAEIKEGRLYGRGRRTTRAA